MENMNKDNWLSLARTVLKIAGSAAVTFGFATAGQVDAITTAVLELGGAAIGAIGVFWSFWHHSPDEPAR